MPEDSPLGKQIRHEFATANSLTHVCLPYTLATRNSDIDVDTFFL